MEHAPHAVNRSGAADQPASRGALRLQHLFTKRLSRLAEMKATRQLNEQQRRLLDYALYSTYWDCVRLGLREEARRLLKLPTS